MAEETQLREAVALVVYCSTTKRFLFLTELMTKPTTFKVAGMVSIPIEGMHPGESREDGICRLQQEEIGMALDGEIRFAPDLVNGFAHHIPIHLAWITVAEEFDAEPTHSHEVAHRGWLTREQVRKLASAPDALRIEVIRLLEVYEHCACLVTA